MNNRIIFIFFALLALITVALSIYAGLKSSLLIVGLIIMIGLSGVIIELGVEKALQKKKILFKLFELVEKLIILFCVYILILGLYEYYSDANDLNKILFLIATAFIIYYRLKKYIHSKEQYS